MAYERVNWENLPSKNTPVNADNLNKMDEGIDAKQDKMTAGTGIEITGENIINNLNANYSTEEQVIGKWIDGKPLYRKTINVGTLPNNTVLRVAHNIINYDRFVNIIGSAKSPTQSLTFPFVGGDPSYNIAIQVTADYIVIITSSDRSAFNGYVTLEYTKTTD